MHLHPAAFASDARHSQHPVAQPCPGAPGLGVGANLVPSMVPLTAQPLMTTPSSGCSQAGAAGLELGVWSRSEEGSLEYKWALHGHRGQHALSLSLWGNPQGGGGGCSLCHCEAGEKRGEPRRETGVCMHTPPLCSSSWKQQRAVIDNQWSPLEKLLAFPHGSQPPDG